MADSRVDLVKSPIGIAVNRGAEAGHLLGASDQGRAARGKDDRLFRQRQRRLCFHRDVSKTRHCRGDEGQGEEDSGDPVGEIVARGDAEIGFQQISELRPVGGIDIVGPLPDELQKITVFSAGIAAVSREPDAGKALIKFLAHRKPATPSSRAASIRSRRARRIRAAP